jgi:hypothetical protein
VRLIAGLGLLAAGVAHGAYPGPEADDPVVRDCLARTLPERAMTQKIRFKTYDRGDLLGESAADLSWKRFEDGGSRALVRLTAPPRKTGLALLAEEKADNTLRQDVTVYLPELRIVRRISGAALSGSMFGTNFSYDDFVQLQGMLHKRSVNRLADETVNERPAYVLETVPQHPDSRYTRIITSIDHAWCVAVQLRFYGEEDVLLKELVVDPESVHEVGGRWIPHAFVLTEHDKSGRTELIVDRVEVDPELNPKLFTEVELRRVR